MIVHVSACSNACPKKQDTYPVLLACRAHCSIFALTACGNPTTYIDRPLGLHKRYNRCDGACNFPGRAPCQQCYCAILYTSARLPRLFARQRQSDRESDSRSPLDTNPKLTSSLDKNVRRASCQYTSSSRCLVSCSQRCI